MGHDKQKNYKRFYTVLPVIFYNAFISVCNLYASALSNAYAVSLYLAALKRFMPSVKHSAAVVCAKKWFERNKNIRIETVFFCYC
jgi:hypothetical protein